MWDMWMGSNMQKTSVRTVGVTDLQVHVSNKSSFAWTLTFSVDRIFARIAILSIKKCTKLRKTVDGYSTGIPNISASQFRWIGPLSLRTQACSLFLNVKFRECLDVFIHGSGRFLDNIRVRSNSA